MEQLKKLLPILQTVKNNKFIALLIFILFWTALLIYAGTLTSGFHFIDDHEIVRIHHDIVQTNLFATLSDWVIRDFNLRFRPFYYFHRVLTVFFLGDNFVLLSIQNLILAIGTSFTLFLSFRNFKFGAIQSYIFVFLALIGAQAAIWWRLGPNETIAIFTFSVGLYFLSKSYCVVKRANFYKYLGLAFFILASLSKESFIALIPAILLINFLLHFRKNKTNIKENLLKNKWFNIILSIIFVLEGYLILFVVGVNKIGYAGGDQSSFNPRRLLAILRDLLTQANWQLLVFVVVIWIIAVALCFNKDNKLPVKNFKTVALGLILSGIILLPQLVLHAKSGIYERYLIPSTLGIAFIILFFINQSLELIQNLKLRLLTFLVVLAFAFYPILYNDLKLTVDNAQAFTSDGKNTNAALEKTITESSADATIFIVADSVANFESGYSLKYYLSYKANRPNFYYDVLSNSDKLDTFSQGLKDGFVNFLDVSLVDDLADKNTDVIFVFANIEPKFLETSTNWFKAEKYTKFGYKDYIVYVRNPIL